jgi:hypothetical protein
MGWPMCRQEGCESVATFRFTWPGKPESHVCVDCAVKLKSVASALGLPLFLSPAQMLPDVAVEVE